MGIGRTLWHTSAAWDPRDYLMCALLTGHEILTLSQQPSQQDWESRGQLIPLLEQVTQHSQSQIQCAGGIHLTEGKFCKDERGEPWMCCWEPTGSLCRIRRQRKSQVKSLPPPGREAGGRGSLRVICCLYTRMNHRPEPHHFHAPYPSVDRSCPIYRNLSPQPSWKDIRKASHPAFPLQACWQCLTSITYAPSSKASPIEHMTH